MGPQFNFKSLGEPFEADWPVAVSVPQDGGTAEKQEFTARFRLVRQEELTEILAEAGKDELDVYRKFFVGFGKPTSEAEELTDEVFNQLVTTPFTREALLAAYRKFAQGIAVKN